MNVMIAVSSLRHRSLMFSATFVSVLLGAALMGTFATLFETSFGALSADDADTLRVIGGVVGAWGSVIVLFSTASTLSIIVGQRAEEIAVLRLLGATARQVRRLVALESFGVAVPAAGIGVALASQAGPGVLSLLRRGSVVSQDADYSGGVFSLCATLVAVIAVSVTAALITARRASRGVPNFSLHESRAGHSVMRWWRAVAGGLLIVYGVVLAVVTVAVTGHDDDPYAAMSTSGSSCVLVGVGFAILAPVLLRAGGALAGVGANRWRSPGWLARVNTMRRSFLLGSVLAPIIVLTSTSTGVLMLVGIDHRTIGAGHPESSTVNLLNNVITGMISLFAAIMVVNAFVAVLAGRRRELARLRLLGATAGQVKRSVVAEAAIIAGVGVVFGGVASLATIVPFAVARGEGIVPDGQLWLPPLLLLAAAAVTVVTARGAAGRLDLTADRLR